jgi:DNA-binding CsgD family transcriptional regulator/catechol 2,3-dioxygenase-like lactoylglutathione lyase family enzyme
MTNEGRRGRPPHRDVLTPAEWRVVEAVRHGMANAEIARRQQVSRDAVKFHVANALLKLGLSSRAELRRWNGVRRGSALDAKERDLMQALQLGAIGQIARHVADIDAARHWYGEVLGLTHLFSFGNMAFYDCGGVRLFLSADHGANPKDSLIYFRVDDIRQAQAELEARGIAFVHAPHLIHTHADGTEEWMGFFNDNEGRPLAIMSQVMPV